MRRAGKVGRAGARLLPRLETCVMAAAVVALIVHLGLDPIWFGILIVVVVEIGLISPPVGMNLFVLNALLPHVPTRTLFHGVLPFMVADVVRLAILIAFPAISLWLPSLMR